MTAAHQLGKAPKATTPPPGPLVVTCRSDEYQSAFSGLSGVKPGRFTPLSPLNAVVGAEYTLV